ncbi:hypothetical protein CP979_32915 [Streptomyces filamentosus]|nr:hypothetical protein CP979_32915 [Streptomyces filamentosus]
MTAKTRVVVIGGGYAGVRSVNRVTRRDDVSARITGLSCVRDLLQPSRFTSPTSLALRWSIRPYRAASRAAQQVRTATRC